MINGIISVLVVFIIMGVGYFFTAKERWPETSNKAFSVAVVQIAAPSLAVVSISEHFTPELLKSSFFNLLVIAGTIFIMHFSGRLFSWLFRLPEKKKAVFEVTFTFNNTMFIGLPINTIVFGREGLPYLFTFYLVTIIMFWTLGATRLSQACDGGNRTSAIKKIISPGLIGVFIGCLLAGTALELPLILLKALSYLGDMCVPLSLLVIGSNLAKSFKKGLPKITADMIVILAGKFILHPLIVFCAFSLLGIGGLPLKVFILTSSLPCHAQTAIMAEYYDLEGEYASALVSLSTMASLITIPLYAAILI